MSRRRGDWFSPLAGAYARYRPGYPAALFDWLAAEAGAGALAWDCGCGSGQASVPLARRGLRVVASDISLAQLRHGEAGDGLLYVAQRAERCALPDASAALVLVAQALHWFDLPRFFAEVDRVLVPGGLLAVASYGVQHIDDGHIDAIIQDFYNNVIGPWWPPQRRVVEAGYAGIELPWQALACPGFDMHVRWNLEQVLGYFSSWSAVRRYREGTGQDPLPALAQRLRPLWGRPGASVSVSWPLVLRASRKPADRYEVAD